MEHVPETLSLNTIQHIIRDLKALLKDKSDSYCRTRFNNSKYHLLDSVIEDLDCFECLELLRSAPYRHANARSKRLYR